MLGFAADRSAVQAWEVPGVSGENGGTETFKLCYASIAINIPAMEETPAANTTVLELQSIVLPNLQTWTFQHQSSDPSDPAGTNYGDISQITLPNGGTITYQYARESGTCNGLVLCITSRTVNAGNGNQVWKYAWGNTLNAAGNYTNTVTDPLQNDVQHLFPPAGTSAAPEPRGQYEVQTVYYQGLYTQNQVLNTVTTNYLYQNPNGTIFSAFPQTVTTTMNGLTSEKALMYATVDVNGNTLTKGNQITDEKDYDFGSGSAGALLRDTQTVYEFQTSGGAPYLASNLINLVASSSTYNSGSMLLAQTQYNYDEAAYLTPSTITTQHGSAPLSARGNPTTTIGTLSGSTNPQTHTNWYDTGEVYQQIDALSQTTTYSYSSTYAGSLPTQIANALTQPTTYTYDFNTGKITAIEDPNNNSISYQYNDPMGRLKSVTFPDVYPGTTVHGQRSYQYNDSASPVNVVETVTQTPNAKRRRGI